MLIFREVIAALASPDFLVLIAKPVNLVYAFTCTKPLVICRREGRRKVVWPGRLGRKG